MNSSQFISEIKQYCTSNANPLNIIKYSRYFKEEYTGYGLTSVQIQDLVKKLLKNKTISYQVLIASADELVNSEKFEEPTIFLLLLDGLHKNFTIETFRIIETWFAKSINNWAHADTLGMYILPKFLLSKIVNIYDFDSWILSPYKFQRRCVPVTLIKILKADKKADFNPYFKFIEPLMTDKEREVHQGAGWLLREAWKIQPDSTEQFLLNWKDISPRLIIQYATEKMSTENKNRFKKLK
jgi:3-methyladenine DNA glycosylase AlkD